MGVLEFQTLGVVDLMVRDIECVFDLIVPNRGCGWTKPLCVLVRNILCVQHTVGVRFDGTVDMLDCVVPNIWVCYI